MGELNALELVLVAVVVSLDNLAASVALGASGVRPARWRLALTFAAFGGATPMLGIWIGRALSTTLQTSAEAVGIATLTGLGIWTLVGSLRGSRPTFSSARIHGWRLPLLAAALSTDNLVVGFGLGLHGTEPLVIGMAAGIAVLVATLLGLRLGRGGQRQWGTRASTAAGIMLIVLAGALSLGWI